MIKIYRNEPSETHTTIYEVRAKSDEFAKRYNSKTLAEVIAETGTYYTILRYNDDIVYVSESDAPEEYNGSYDFAKYFSKDKVITNLPYEYYTIIIIKVCESETYTLCEEKLYLYNKEVKQEDPGFKDEDGFGDAEDIGDTTPTTEEELDFGVKLPDEEEMGQ